MKEIKKEDLKGNITDNPLFKDNTEFDPVFFQALKDTIIERDNNS